MDQLSTKSHLELDEHQGPTSKKFKRDKSTLDVGNSTSKQKSHLYENKLILAPMVRANSLPFRLLCLKYGADLVYSEELIDHRVVTCKRIENQLLGTVDFVDKDGRVIFRTCDEEKDRVVFQLGSNDPERALKAAKLVSQDVMGIDFNFGCPKKFSIAGGMGAALLENPDKIEALLTTCVRELDIPVTCKMRLLPKLDDTLKLVKLIQSCGVSAIAVHGRTRDQRPAHDNDIKALKAIGEVLSIPLIANGESNNLKTHDDVIKFRLQTGASSVMIARAAMKNPLIFSRLYPSNESPSELKHEKMQLNVCGHEPSTNADNVTKNNDANKELSEKMMNSKEDYNVRGISNEIIEEYVKLAVRFDNHPSNVKYSLQSLMSNCEHRRGKEFLANFHKANNLQSICQLFNVPFVNRSKLTENSTSFDDQASMVNCRTDENSANEQQTK